MRLGLILLHDQHYLQLKAGGELPKLQRRFSATLETEASKVDIPNFWLVKSQVLMGEIIFFNSMPISPPSSPVDQSPPIPKQEQLINQQIEEKRAKLRSYFDVGARR